MCFASVFPHRVCFARAEAAHHPWWLYPLAPGFGCKYAVEVNLGGLGPLGALHDPWVLRKPRMNPHA